MHNKNGLQTMKGSLQSTFDAAKRNWIHIAMVLLVVIAAVAIKWIYFETAESAYNVEELPLASMALVAGNSHLSDIAATRLYGTAPITTALSLKAFGFSVFAIKFPNLVFFFAALAFVYLTARNLFGKEARGFALVPVVLFALGPPVTQIWAMKNRGGFIENIFALAFCIWVCSRRGAAGTSQLANLCLAIVIGLAAWSQPIAFVWGLAVVAYLLAVDFKQGPTRPIKTVPILLFGLAVGMMPLILLNFLFNFNTFKVIDAGELIAGADLGHMGRFKEILSGGIPRLLGLKEQWSNDWTLYPPIARTIYILLVVPAAISAITAVLAFIRSRQVTIGLLLVATAVAVIGANVFSTWGNFQLEPRRLLLLYVPYFLLTAQALSKSRALTVLFMALWLTFNTWANYSYVEKNKHGFSHPMYTPLNDLATFLEKRHIDGVYTDVWTGGRVTFASQGRIAWFKSDYIPGAYGFVSDEQFEPTEAFLFNLNRPESRTERDRFLEDIKKAKVQCEIDTIQQISVVHDCGENIDLAELPFGLPDLQAGASGDIVLDISINDERVSSVVGFKKGGLITSKGEAGYLMYGPYSAIGPGKYKVLLLGDSSTSFVVDAAAMNGKRVLGSRQYIKAQSSINGELAELEFDVPRSIRDFEIRILVPPGADTRVKGYKIVRR
ncbi:glycosyltransferase family 39 protein [Pseudoxanthomonas sacheonensis]|uniref:Glycosyltransferase RgtA/B/C/D-like domain-containing protein n=1 Tax=Pseudoxanthomonas sacheonensis TaxID=443615 RepID=A0ABU1RVW5_9GAMM|nr:glycosyltransferase family 39 protein [Pseudoxanthomonas sacheonensis]MDR6842921.1 hypothetical protein [Pseudoxanthomonas sacheonensis]